MKEGPSIKNYLLTTIVKLFQTFFNLHFGGMLHGIDVIGEYSTCYKAKYSSGDYIYEFPIEIQNRFLNVEI